MPRINRLQITSASLTLGSAYSDNFLGDHLKLVQFVFLIIAVACLTGCLKVKDQNEIPKVIKPLETKVTLESCEKDFTLCAAVDIESSEAKQSYEKGCEAKEFYACFRLGQLHELKNKDFMTAVKSYEIGCNGFDQFSCEAEIELRSTQCYLENNKEFCKGEPTGEYRILLFLQSLSPKYQDAFVNHNFLYSFSLEEVSSLYKKRLIEKNPKLLSALNYAKKNGRHDGVNSERLQEDIESFSAKKKNKN